MLHNINDINKWIIGANILTDHSSLPKIDVEIEINQAIKGGFEKYPNSILFDQSQYCASSTDNSNGEMYKEYIF